MSSCSSRAVIEKGSGVLFRKLLSTLIAAGLVLAGLSSFDVEARNPRGAVSANVLGYDGALQVTAGGVIANGHGQAIMLRGGNMAGLQDQTIVNGNRFSVQSVWGNQGGTGGAPNWPFIASQHLNAVRIPINAQSFQNTSSRNLVWGGTLGTSSWGSTVSVGDPTGNYRTAILQSILQARAHGMYIVFECHESAPQFTVGGTTQYLTAIDQPPFIDAQNGGSFWTDPGTTLGFPAWLAANFGSAAFNTAYNSGAGINGGAAGAHFSSSFGGGSGVNDFIFELFNEPYLSNMQITLTTQAGTFGNPAWKAHNGGSNYTTTNGGTPPATPGSSWTAGAEFVMLFGGFGDNFTQQQDGNTTQGIPANFTNSHNGASNTLAVQWQIIGYQQLLTGIRGLGFTNIIGVNGSGFASALQTLPYYLPVDTLNPPQMVVDSHAYPPSSPAGSGVQPSTLDAQNVFTSYTQINAGTLTSIPNAMPVLITETGDEAGTGFTEFYIPQMTTHVDAATKGGIGMFPWIANDAYPAAAGNTIHQMNISGGDYTFVGTLSSGIMTVTSASSTILPGSVLVSGLSNNDVNGGSYIDVYGAGGTTGSGGTGTYLIVTQLGTSLTQGSTTYTARPVIPWSGQGVAYYGWTQPHTNYVIPALPLFPMLSRRGRRRRRFSSAQLTQGHL
jgi:hypothetical protein